MAATGCAGISDDKAMLKEGSAPVQLQSTYGGTKLQFTMSWIDNCEGPEQDARFPSENRTTLATRAGSSC